MMGSKPTSSMARQPRIAAMVILVLLTALLVPGSRPAARAAGSAITVDAARVQGVINPQTSGGMFEWASTEMNGAWADKVANRSFEYETVYNNRSPLYDHFDSGSLDSSKWTPTLVAGSTAGSVSVANSVLTISGGSNSRYGVLTTDITNTAMKTTTIEAKLTSYSGTNALLNVYGGTGAGDFSHFVEFGIEGGVLKVYTASGVGNWVGPSVTTPAVLRVVVGYYSNGSRTFTFYYNGTQEYTLTGNTDVTVDPLRVFLYGYGSSTTNWDYLTISQDNTYDAFAGSSLSSLWTPTLLAGSTAGSVSEGSGNLTINGGSNSRYGVLSNYISRSAIDWTTAGVTLNSVSGTNGLLNIYGGSGAGDFSHFVEFGVEGGVLKVFTANGSGQWVGPAVTLPGTLSVQVTPWYTNGRNLTFYWNGSQVYSLSNDQNVPAGDFRLFLYGWSTSATTWNTATVSQQHFDDAFGPHFEGTTLPGQWQMELLAGTSWGSYQVNNGKITISGGANSRYGVMDPWLDESDIYGYQVTAQLESYSGTNALLNLYGGTGRGDFSNYVEFGIEGGVLKVFTPNGVGNWVGGSATTPATLSILAGPYGANGRNLYFFYNNSLVYALQNYTQLPNKEYNVFLYGWGTSTTTWDYLTTRKVGDWGEDGYADRAVYSLDRNNPYNGASAMRIDLSQHNGGRKGISLPDVAVTANHNYTLNVWLRQGNMSGAVTALLGPAGGDGPSYAAYASGSIASVGTTWTKYTLTLTPNATDQHAKLLLSFASTGTLWLDMASLMPTDPSEVSDGGFRADWVNSLVAANPGNLRWPGGIVADWQHWQNGVGTRDSRPPIYYGQWDAEWMTNDVGTDEFLQFAANHGITPYLNVNWGTGSASEAANWVQYTNGATSTTYGAQRQANGHSAAYNVKHWGIGNETWGEWTPNWTGDAHVFATSANSFANTMLGQDGSLLLTVEGGDGNNGNSANNNDWNREVVANNDTLMNSLAIHYYSPQGLPQGYADLDVYHAAVGAPYTLLNRMLATQNVVAGETAQNVKLAITEYNAMYFNEEHHRTRSLEASLQVAGMLNSWARNPQLADFNHYSEVANFWDGGYIRMGSRGILNTPSYYALNLFSNNHGPLSLLTGVTSPTYSAPAMGNLPAATVPILDAAATKSADGTALYLAVVNRDDTNSQSATLNLNNAGTVSGTATAYTLGSGVSYTAQNTWQSPNTVTYSTNTVTGVSSSFSYTFPAHSYTILKFTVSAGSTSVPAISGRVTDANGNGLSGATVLVAGGNSAITDSNGYYLVSVPGAGYYILSATLNGYTQGFRRGVWVDAGGGTPLPIILTQASTLTDLYDDFPGPGLSSNWTASTLSGSGSGSYSLSNSRVTINGVAGANYGLLSKAIAGSGAHTAYFEAQLAASGGDGRLNLYGGNGGWSNYLEFGIVGGYPKVTGSDGTNWTGSTSVTLPATLRVQASEGSSRTFTFWVNGQQVWSGTSSALPTSDYNLFVYGPGAATSTWDYVSAYVDNLGTSYDQFNGSSLNTSLWSTLQMQGSSSGSVSEGSGLLTINGGANSRYGVESSASWGSGSGTTTIEAKVASFSGRNAFVHLDGSGNGTFNNYVEFGLGENSHLEMWQSGGAGWEGQQVSAPAAIKLVVSNYVSGSGRTVDLYGDGRKLYSFTTTALPGTGFKVFLYGYDTSTTNWDWITVN